MTRTLCILLVTGAAWSAAQITDAQPLLDRVLDRVEQELENRTKPIPVEDEPTLADPEREGAAEGENKEPGYLGVIADDRQEQGRGVRVLEVVANSPAEQGGLAKNDLIVAINTRPIRTMDEMARILSAMPAGTEVIFDVRRDDGKNAVAVVLGERPAPGQRRLENFGRQPEEIRDGSRLVAPSNRPKLGVRTLPVTAQARQEFNLPGGDGAIVVAVTPGSPAERAGIRPGAVITNVDGKAVRDPNQLAEIVAGAGDRDKMAIMLIQDGRPSRVTVSFGEEPRRRVVERPREPAPSEDEPAADETRTEALERRLQELEDRIEKIEQSLEKKT